MSEIINSAAAGGSGTVTSVTFTGDGTVLSSTPSAAVTTSGTLTATLATPAAGTFLSNVTGGAAAPAFNSIATYLASPAAIGGSTPAAGSFTTLSTTGAATFGAAADKTGQAVITAPTSGINTVETILVQTPALAASRIQAGTVVRVNLAGACTTTAANTSNFLVRIGTAGTTSDTAVFTWTTQAAGTTGTGISFHVEILITFRTVGATSTAFGTGSITCKTNSGIIAATGSSDTMGSYTSINTTTANLIISVSYVAAASTTTSTFQQGFIEIVNK